MNEYWCNDSQITFHPSPDVAELLLDFSHGLEISRTVESVTSHEQKLDQISRDVSSGDIKTPREVGQRKAVVHWNDVRHAIARVDHDTSRQTYIIFSKEKGVQLLPHGTHLVRRASARPGSRRTRLGSRIPRT